MKQNKVSRDEDVTGLVTDLPPPIRRLSLGFNPMEWTVGAGMVVLVLVMVIVALVGALFALAQR